MGTTDVTSANRWALGRLDMETTWGLILVIPYVCVFLAFVVYPIGYGFVLGSDPESYRTLLDDPIFARTMRNTLLFVFGAVNLKLFLALLLSGFLAQPYRWIRWMSILFILPWAVPAIPSILSFRWMLNSEFGMVNHFLGIIGIEGVWWLNRPDIALGSVFAVHIWKYLPFWTLILLAARMAVPRDLYETAELDGATAFQKFRYVTFPHIRNVYITSTLLSTIFTLGDFNSVYLLTGGGPVDATHVLATLGIRYAFDLGEIGLGVATVITALPVMVPLVILLIRRLGRGETV